MSGSLRCIVGFACQVNLGFFAKVYFIWKEIKVKYFFFEVILSRPLGWDHSCCFLNWRETLGSESNVKLSLQFCRGKHKIWQRRILIQIFCNGVQGILTMAHPWTLSYYDIHETRAFLTSYCNGIWQGQGCGAGLGYLCRSKLSLRWLTRVLELNTFCIQKRGKNKNLIMFSDTHFWLEDIKLCVIEFKLSALSANC